MRSYLQEVPPEICPYVRRPFGGPLTRPAGRVVSWETFRDLQIYDWSQVVRLSN